jgi:hypothetical protein
MSWHMSDDRQQHGSKIRIKIWVLVMVMVMVIMAVYTGFIYLHILAGSNGVE